MANQHLSAPACDLRRIEENMHPHAKACQPHGHFKVLKLFSTLQNYSHHPINETLLGTSCMFASIWFIPPDPASAHSRKHPGTCQVYREIVLCADAFLLLHRPLVHSYLRLAPFPRSACPIIMAIIDTSPTNPHPHHCRNKHSRSNAIRMKRPFAACRKYAALGSLSTPTVISSTRGSGCMSTACGRSFLQSSSSMINLPLHSSYSSGRS
jgi:hypothetical protein